MLARSCVKCINCFKEGSFEGWHSGVVISTVASQLKGSGLESTGRTQVGQVLFYVAVLFLCLLGFTLGTLASSNSPKIIVRHNLISVL